MRGAFRAESAELVLFGEDGRPADAEPQPGRREAGRPAAARAPGGRRPRWSRGPTRPASLTARTGTVRDAELDRYAARHALKDAMASVLSTEGRVQGLLLVTGRLGDVGTFAGSDLALLETFARHVATSLDRGRLETDLRRVIELQEELRHAAMHDPLTELPNRTLFLDRTEHDLHLAGRNGQWPAVLYIDLDGFKPVNDTYGHQAGDLLLKVFAQRLHERGAHRRHRRPPGRRRVRRAAARPDRRRRRARRRSTASAPSSTSPSTWAAGGRRRSAPASASPSPGPTPTSTA